MLTGPAAWKLRTALIAIVLVCYSNAFGLGVALDGEQFVNTEQRTRAATWVNVERIFTTDYWWPDSMDLLYRPLTVLSFLVNYSILGNESRPAGYHALNIALHAVNVLLVFALAERLLRRRWTAFFAAMLWAVHPIGVEAVANVAGRADLLAAGALLGALLVHSGDGRPSRRAVAVFLLAMCAAFSKETGAVLIPLMAIWDLTAGRVRAWKRHAPAYAAAAAALAIYLFARSAVLAQRPWPLQPYVANQLYLGSFWAARFTAIRLLGADLVLLVWPARLTCDYWFNEVPIATLADWRAWLSLAVVVAIGVGVLLRRRVAPELLFAAGLSAIALLPASNLIVLIGAPMADRFLYVPSIGFAIAAAALVYRATPTRAAAILAIAATGLCARTVIRNENWSSSLSLMGHDATISANSFRVHGLYGEYLYVASPRGNLDRAIAEEEKSWSILQSLPDGRSNPQTLGSLAGLYGDKGDLTGGPEALAWYRKGLAAAQRADLISRALERKRDELQREHGRPLPPRIPAQRLYFLLGEMYRKTGQFPESLDSYRYGRTLSPSYAPAYEGAIASFRAMGDSGSAAVLSLEESLAAGSTPQSVNTLAQVYADVPGGECAVIVRAGIPTLNTDCPRLRSDICRAVSDLGRTYVDARQPGRAAELEKTAASYGCARSGGVPGH